MSGLFKSKQVTPEVVGQESPQAQRVAELWGELSPVLKDYISSKAGKPYSGELVAPLTSMETQGMSQLQDYMNSPMASQSPEYKMAQTEIGRIFGDYYDPFKEGGPIDYTRTQLEKYLNNDILPSLRHNAAISGGLYSSGFTQSEDEASGNIMDSLAKYAYQAEDNLRTSRQNLIPVAANFATETTDEPIRRLMNVMGLAGYERTNYTQPLDTANYQDYLNQISQLQGLLGAGTGLAGISDTALAYPQYQPSTFSKYIMPILQSGAQGASAAMVAGA